MASIHGPTVANFSMRLGAAILLGCLSITAGCGESAPGDGGTGGGGAAGDQGSAGGNGGSVPASGSGGATPSNGGAGGAAGNGAGGATQEEPKPASQLTAADCILGGVRIVLRPDPKTGLREDVLTFSASRGHPGCVGTADLGRLEGIYIRVAVPDDLDRYPFEITSSGFDQWQEDAIAKRITETGMSREEILQACWDASLAAPRSAAGKCGGPPVTQ